MIEDIDQHREPAPVLESRDYRNLLSVLDDAAHSPEGEFFDHLSEALARRLGWTDSIIVDIPDELAPFPTRSVAPDHVHTARPAVFVEEYLDRWHLRNPFKTAGAGLLLRENGAVALADLRPCSTEAEWAFVDGYLHRHRIADVLYGYVAVGADGSTLICRYVSDESDIDDRDRELMKLLTRHLSPQVRHHFAHSRKNTASAALTDREAQVARLVAMGRTNRQIADELQIRCDTVKKHVMLAMKKTGAENRTQLALIHLGR